ncbi:histidine kinase [Thermoanaerobacterium thermosaccharolyticum]|uniref:histidine kinase n=1 Tax=Thermoanaerobacterium thermosaccharolyticum TaxID=1517 RepID=A0A223I1M0_THETR|nr:LytS/YhcK type 5TM receptor domain-containing protein [Thermoanaerobacterium thermosaccharolyticum]AST58454.1 histidine kinase [Thermoanaerobacterium thermosaccharolyticum]
MSKIFIPMMYELSVLITLAFLMSKLHVFRNLILLKNANIYQKIFLSIIFGSFGIIGTYTGIPVNGALANSRAVGVIIGGLLGGPFVGILSGLIAGIHRNLIDIGGFTAFACAVSTAVEGTVAGLLSSSLKRTKNRFLFAFATGVINESLQMIIILLLAKPFSEALNLVKIIWIPMSLLNSLGISVFILIIDGIFIEQDRMLANLAKVITEIAGRLLKCFKEGYNEETAQSAARIIKNLIQADAISFTDKEKILAHVGLGSDHHKVGNRLQTKITEEAIATGRIKVAQSKREIECDNEKCQLRSAIIVPLKKGDETIGVFKMYKKEPYAISNFDIKLAQGLSQLISTQLEIHDVEYKEKLLEKARFKALQAQINPHFLFNSLNTIMSLCRIDPLKARDVLLNLSQYLRRNMEIENDLISIDDEMEHVKSFVSIQKARFGNKINVKYRIDENCDLLLPPLTIQPLVENSIKHGLLKKVHGGTVAIYVRHYQKGYKITIRDDGVGMDAKYIKNLLNKKDKSLGKIGLINVNKRLISYFGDCSHLKITSKKGIGTQISFYIPKKGDVAKDESIVG